MKKITQGIRILLMSNLFILMFVFCSPAKAGVACFAGCVSACCAT